MRLWIVLPLVCLLACASRVDSEANEGTQTSGESSITDPDSSSGGASQCDAYADAEPGPTVAIEIHNVGDAPVLFNQPCASLEYFDVSNAAGWSWPLPACASTCEGGLLYGCSACAGCVGAGYTILGPDEMMTIEWPSLLHEEVLPPAECVDDLCGLQCAQARNVEDAGAITVTIDVITYADCVAAEPERSSCECDPADAVVPCTSYGSLSPPTSFVSTTTFQPVEGPLRVEIAGS